VFAGIGRFAVRRRAWVLVASGLFVVVASAVGSTVFPRLSPAGFADPSSESERASAILDSRFHTGTPNLVLLLDARPHDAVAGAPAVDAPSVEAAADHLTKQLAARHDVREVVSYWSLGNVPPLRSKNGRTAIVAVLTVGTGGDAEPPEVAAVANSAVGRRGPITITAAGSGPVFRAVSTTIQNDLKRAEVIAVPLTIALLIVVFGGLIAAGLPLVVGVSSVSGTFFILWLITQFTQVSIFSINLATALGLGLAVDYSLFIVSRYREELDAGRDPDDAVLRTVQTAGRTVAVSGLTVAVSLSALLVFPLYFLRSFAYAGIGVTVVSLAASLLTLPALLSLTGRRIDSLRVIRRRPSASDGSTHRRLEDGFWHRSATFVMRHPVVIGGSIVMLLVVLGSPFTRVDFGLPDARVLPADNPASVQTARLSSEFSSNEGAAFPVIAPRAAGGDRAVDATAAAISSLEGAGRVDAPTGRFVKGAKALGPDASLAAFRVGDAVRFSVVPTVPTISDAGQQLVSTIRSTRYEVGDVIVGGRSASLIDTKASIAKRIPWAIAIITLATFVLLFLLFGSVLIPIKAIVLSLLSLTATFGAVVWIFQEGHFAHQLGFTATGLTDTTTPILMFCIAFGLSMDYEVFLLSRIKEEHDRTGDSNEAVAAGLEKTGRIVTAAAVLLAITFIATATSDVTFIKLFGVGLALAVLMDATLVRGGLVPAFMRLVGEANWWAPGPMRRLYQRFGFSESGAHAEPPPAATVDDAVPVEGPTALDPRA
jgi:putative drug exporter of the RND superfamily